MNTATIMHKLTITQAARQIFCAAGLAVCSVFPLAAQVSTSIGVITFQVGDARLERGGVITSITKGQSLNVGDRLLTGADGHVHARMIDNGFISVRPSAKLEIKSYVYAPQDATANRVGLTLESGVARTISGKAGEAARENYRFNTPVAAIGLRGTDYVVQALPDTTRVSVSKGAITMSAFGPTCSVSSLSPCTGPLVRELVAGSPHAYMEVRVQGGFPVIVLPDSTKETPNKASPPRPEERRVLSEAPSTTALVTEILSTPLSPKPPEAAPPVAVIVAPTPIPIPTPVAALPAKPIGPEIAWGRWSNVAIQDIPTLVSLASDDREITFSNPLFGLLRPNNSSNFPASGVITMKFLQGDVYLQSSPTRAPQTLTQAQFINANLQLDFNNRQFGTQLSAIARGTTHELSAQGSIHPQGLLLVDPTRSNMNLSGALSNNANEAGYLFDAIVGPSQQLIGATRWGR